MVRMDPCTLRDRSMRVKQQAANISHGTLDELRADLLFALFSFFCRTESSF